MTSINTRLDVKPLDASKTARLGASPGERLKLAIVASHPIQYHAPWYQRLAQLTDIELKVFYGIVPNRDQQGVGFGVSFEWDIPVLEGYEWAVLRNDARKPGIDHFFGCNCPSIRRELMRFGPDVVLLTGWHSFVLLQALWAAIRLGVPRIVRGESNAIRSRPGWKKMAHRLLLGRYDGFLAIGQSNREFYEQAGISPDRIFHCPYFVDNERFSRESIGLARQRPDIRARFGIPDKATCFLFVGKLIPKKRILDATEALERVTSQGMDVHLLIVGDGKMRSHVLGRMARDVVSLTGFLNQSEISRAYVAADCLVLPSDCDETWGLVVNEAMASGLPAVVSDQVGCAGDLVEPGITGEVFRMGDVESLAEKMSSLASHPARLISMGEAAKRYATHHYTVEAAVEGVLQAVESVVRSRDD